MFVRSFVRSRGGGGGDPGSFVRLFIHFNIHVALYSHVFLFKPYWES